MPETYNRLHRIKTCSTCGKDYSITRTFKFGYAWCMTYRIGDKIELDEKGNIPVDKLETGKCPHCTGQSDFDIIVKNKRLYWSPRRVRYVAKEKAKQKETITV